MTPLRAWAIGIAASVCILVALFLPAHSHDAPMGWKYDGWCCNGGTVTGDCQPIPATAVRVVDGGFEITLRPGDHWMVTKPHTWFRRMDEVRISKDENFHACLYPDEATLRCFYVVPMGS